MPAFVHPRAVRPIMPGHWRRRWTGLRIGGDEGAVDAHVVLLLALGILAERAGRAPLPMRVVVMGFLRQAESVAWDFIAGVTGTGRRG